MRVARQKNSAFHDGFETTYYHANCHHASGGHGIKGLEMIENLGEARVEDQLVLLDKMGVKVFQSPQCVLVGEGSPAHDRKDSRREAREQQSMAGKTGDWRRKQHARAPATDLIRIDRTWLA